jgi:hypothetical protein
MALQKIYLSTIRHYKIAILRASLNKVVKALGYKPEGSGFETR